MDKLVIEGGYPLSGEVVISGAKNAALPILCAGLLSADTVHLENVPDLQDVRTMLKLLRPDGRARRTGRRRRVTLNASKVDNLDAPYEMVKTMRASILVLGPLVARFGEAQVSLPGGCAIGARPVDQHIKGLQAMGAEITIEHGYHRSAREASEGRAHRHRHDHRHRHRKPADGRRAGRRRNRASKTPRASRKSAISRNLLVAMGAKIDGIGTDRLVIQGVDKLHGAQHTVIAGPDRSRHVPVRGGGSRRRCDAAQSASA